MRLSLLAFAVFMIATPALAMDGVNIDSGDVFTVDDATTFKVGDTVAVYDADGNESDLEVQAVKDTGAALDVDFLDPDSGEATSIEFAKAAPAAQ
jgi:hypothetical protein